MTGFYGYTIGFGNDTLAYTGGEDIFVTRYDAAGNVTWARSVAGQGFENGSAIDVNDAGTSLCIAGFVNGAPLSFGPYTVNANSANNYFVAKADMTTSIGNTPLHNDPHSFFPNPASSLIHFLNAAPNTTVRISDVQGRTVYETTLGKDKTINASQLPDGFYTLTLSGKTTARNKLIIQH